MANAAWNALPLPAEMVGVLSRSPQVHVASSVEQLLGMACGGSDAQTFSVSYRLPSDEVIVEAEVTRVRNGVSVNYPDPYMRRRDPD